MEANGGEPGPTPRWWRVTIFARPLKPGVDGLEDVLRPIIDALAGLERLDERSIIVVPDAIDQPRRIDDP